MWPLSLQPISYSWMQFSSLISEGYIPLLQPMVLKWADYLLSRLPCPSHFPRPPSLPFLSSWVAEELRVVRNSSYLHNLRGVICNPDGGSNMPRSLVSFLFVLCSPSRKPSVQDFSVFVFHFFHERNLNGLAGSWRWRWIQRNSSEKDPKVLVEIRFVFLVDTQYPRSATYGRNAWSNFYSSMFIQWIERSSRHRAELNWRGTWRRKQTNVGTTQ